MVFAENENTEGADLQRKYEMLNNLVDQEAREARAEQARRQLQYYGHCKFIFLVQKSNI